MTLPPSWSVTQCGRVSPLVPVVDVPDDPGCLPSCHSLGMRLAAPRRRVLLQWIAMQDDGQYHIRCACRRTAPLLHSKNPTLPPSPSASAVSQEPCTAGIGPIIPHDMRADAHHVCGVLQAPKDVKECELLLAAS